MSARFHEVPGWLDAWRQLVDEVEPVRARAALQGSAMARQGSVEGLVVAPGAVTGTVVERLGAPAEVAVGWRQAPRTAWRQATAMIAGRVGLTASLYERRISGDVAQVLAEAGVPLVPASLADLDMRCDRGDGPWCRHGFAVLGAFVARMRVDAASVLRLRGRDVDELVRDVRRHRGGSGGPQRPVEGHGELAGIAVRPRLAEAPSWLLRELGMPPGLEDQVDLSRIMADAAAMAWNLASGDGADAADEQLVLAELRARHAASAQDVAEALGIAEPTTRLVLDDLYRRGLVLRTGSGDRARYRASVARARR